MRIVQAYPPLIDAIDGAFGVIGKPILFAWGDRIYNPAGVTVPAELLAHEKVHGERQSAYAFGAGLEDKVQAWWGEYIANPTFRLEEEMPAHVVEFKSLCEQHRAKWTSERNMRRTFAAHVARKLSAPLYGRLVTFEAAKKFLLAA